MTKLFMLLWALCPAFLFSQQTIELCEGESQTVTYFSVYGGDGANSWSVNGQVFAGDELTYTFSEEGNYVIVLRRENGLCYAEEFFQVNVDVCDGIVYWVPNTFTPDGNEYNQTFGPVMTEGYDVENFSFMIFNRWGEVIWESRDPAGRWDGYYGGRLCQDGVYTWKISFGVLGNDGRVENSGHVTIIR